MGVSLQGGILGLCSQPSSDHYSLKSGDKVDIGCGKGFSLYDMLKLVPGLQVFGLDIPEYAIQNAKDEIKPNFTSEVMQFELPFQENEFELVFSINTFHNLKTMNSTVPSGKCYEFQNALSISA